MSNLTIEGLTSEQAIAMADGLSASGDHGTARSVYRWALQRETRRLMRYRLRLRLGLMSSPNNHTDWMLRLLRDLETRHQTPVFVSGGMATWFKTQPFLDDERFMSLEEKHQHLLPIANWHWHLQVVAWAVQHTRDVPGELVEMGVFKGHTTLFTAEYLDFQDWPKRWFLFDTFDGIPDDQVDPGWDSINKSIYKGAYSYEDVVQRFAPFPNIEVIRGRVPEILHERCPDRISFLHIDLNNTAAEIAALEFVLDRLSPGAVLILDDYCWASAHAQFQAERKWFAERGLHVLPLPTGQGVFVKK